MTLIASLLFAIAFAASVGVIAFTVSNAIPRISEVIEMEFAPVMQTERRVFFGEIKGLKPVPVAQVIAFPRKAACQTGYRLAA
jgi:hypothetical protein